MIRDSLKDEEWFDKWIKFDSHEINRFIKELKLPTGNPKYRPQFIFELAQAYWNTMLRRYSRGDAIHELMQYFPLMLDAWEESERLGQDVWDEKTQYTRQAWAVNLDNYIFCFWLVGLALALEIPDDQWRRLLVLIDNEGEDEVLDRIIASRDSSRKIGSKLCYPRAYKSLLDALNAPKEEQAIKLKYFVDNWYKELTKLPKKKMSELGALYARPYWYGYHEIDGAYFGYWCIEAVAAVKAFGLDDSLCLGHPNYPGDLLRPNGPSTHPEQVKQPDSDLTARETPEKNTGHFWSRIFNKRKTRLNG